MRAGRAFREFLRFEEDVLNTFIQNCRQLTKLEAVLGFTGTVNLLWTFVYEARDSSSSSALSLVKNVVFYFLTFLTLASSVEAVSRKADQVLAVRNVVSTFVFNFRRRVLAARVLSDLFGLFLACLMVFFLVIPLKMKVNAVNSVIKFLSFLLLSTIIVIAKLHQVLRDVFRRRRVQRNAAFDDTLTPNEAQAEYRNLIAELQVRDLTPEDYTILQQLDSLLDAASSPNAEILSFQEAQGRPVKMKVVDAIAKLPVFTVNTKLFRSYAGKSKTCCVCLEEFEKGDRIKSLPCLHKGHEACMDGWLHVEAKCPVCQVKLEALDRDAKLVLEGLFTD